MTRVSSNHNWARVLFAGVLTLSVASLLADDGPTPWEAPARASRKKNPIPVSADSIAAGKAVYTSQCAKCHGDSGKGDGPSAKDLNPRPKDLSDASVAKQTDGALFWKITNGRKPMPGFETLLPENDRWNVINYIRSIEPAASNQPGGETK